jgi:hypothetical protein
MGTCVSTYVVRTNVAGLITNYGVTSGVSIFVVDHMIGLNWTALVLSLLLFKHPYRGFLYVRYDIFCLLFIFNLDFKLTLIVMLFCCFSLFFAVVFILFVCLFVYSFVVCVYAVFVVAHYAESVREQIKDWITVFYFMYTITTRATPPQYC